MSVTYIHIQISQLTAYETVLQWKSHGSKKKSQEKLGNIFNFKWIYENGMGWLHRYTLFHCISTSLSFIDTVYFTNQKSVAPLPQGSPSHYFSNSICLFHGFLSNFGNSSNISNFFIICYGDMWTVIFYVTTTIHWRLRW